LIPVGFLLLMLQGFSEMVKRWAFLQGQGPDVLSAEDAQSDDQKRAAELEKLAQPQGDH
jgi:TRAP-type mannitol/chloroaromatic compound transport system permease small subunit